MVAADLITQLPHFERGVDSKTTCIDLLSRKIHFIPANMSDTAEEATQAFFENIMPPHGLPDALFSDRDPKFTSNFWRGLMK